MRPAIVIIGIGNVYRNDDGVGIRTLELLRAAKMPDVELVEAGSGASGLADIWEGREIAIVVDATLSGAAPGAIRRIEPGKDPLPRQLFGGSTHNLGLCEMVELGQAIDRMPKRLIVYGIEGRDFGYGAGISPEVDASAHRVAENIIRMLQEEER
ncbi:MAG: hydrogenase maturation protease [Blastocatellales bacterium]|nr:hydrogenase maturation protease [Blastocatellales bacterium]